MTQVDPVLERTRKHVKEIRDFWYHLMVYVFVNALMIAIDRSGGANDGFLGLDFAYFIIIGWGIGVAGHAISVFYGEHKVQTLYAQQQDREGGR
ncbi:MAG: 2TM domain-containing protein [Acidimicrobiia bacterium]|nr:2TM domain-containing protein [Acidimicrobiia bacterium]